MISLESSDARDRIGEMRDGLRLAMRHLSKPGPDWRAASYDLLCVSAAARELSKECCLREMDGRVAFGLMCQEDSEVGDGNSNR